MLKSIVIVCVLSCHLHNAMCQGNQSMCAPCSSSVVLLTKEELKDEIRTVMADVVSENNVQQMSGNCTHYTSIDELNSEMQEFGHNLTELKTSLLPIINKLMNLHQPGMTASHPATTCSEIFTLTPNTPSGYYWLEASNGSAVRAYCNMTLSCKGVGGGWMQITKLDMTNSSHQCPPGTRQKIYQSKRLCQRGSDSAGCSSTMFDTNGIKYNQVCGKIIAYQDKTPDAFRGEQLSIDSHYVDGISLTHGRNPRKHIWTFAAALHEVNTHPTLICPCTNVHVTSPNPPTFTGNDYFCDTGSTHHYQLIFYGDDPLWDGAGCGPLNTCCSLNNPPWFYKRLSTSTHDNIEMRMCSDQAVSNEDTPFEIIELYVK